MGPKQQKNLFNNPLRRGFFCVDVFVVVVVVESGRKKKEFISEKRKKKMSRQNKLIKTKL